jgi:hypothetical protein
MATRAGSDTVLQMRAMRARGTLPATRCGSSIGA